MEMSDLLNLMWFIVVASSEPDKTIKFNVDT